jgi:hypothetical protein
VRGAGGRGDGWPAADAETAGRIRRHGVARR